MKNLTIKVSWLSSFLSQSFNHLKLILDSEQAQEPDHSDEELEKPAMNGRIDESEDSSSGSSFEELSHS